jgi:hypothetical protein
VLSSQRQVPLLTPRLIAGAKAAAAKAVQVGVAQTDNAYRTERYLRFAGIRQEALALSRAQGRCATARDVVGRVVRPRKKRCEADQSGAPPHPQHASHHRVQRGRRKAGGG